MIDNVTPSRAHVLVAEDDATSGRFFTDALETMHCRVDLVVTGADALATARANHYDLLLLDCRMPDFGAIRILSVLSAEPDAASTGSTALATSAELDSAQRRHLRQIGFVDALAKPISLQTLTRTVDTWLPALPGPVLDDAAAISKSGSVESVEALRQLFMRELSVLGSELDAQACRGHELSERLHRLLASCGFCGANALADAARRLKRQLDADTPVTASEMQQFRQTLAATVDALAHQTA